MTSSMVGAAVDALHLAESDPRRSVAPATRIARQARRRGDLAAASIAERALGIASLHLRNSDRAARHLRSAAALADRAGAPPLAAEARLRLAAVLNVGGRTAAALREIDAVAAGSSGIDRARAWAQKGAILLQLGRLEAASENLGSALPDLRAAGDLLWLKRALANRGIARGRLLQFDAAEKDLLAALALNRDLGLDLSVGFIEQNLGWLHSLRGDVPRALAHLDSAERTLRGLDAQIGFLLEDRASLLVSAGLVAEARVAADEAVTALVRERQRIALPDVRILLARVCLEDGDPRGAAVHARRARAEMRRHGRPEAAALAQWLGTLSRASGADRDRVSPSAVRRSAELLEAGGFRSDALEARLLAADLAAERGRDGTADLVAAARHRRAGPPAMRATAWQAEARLRARSGRRRAALAALESGLRIVDANRAEMGATDLRVHAGQRRTRLATAGLRIAIQGASVSEILTWAEHGRSSHLLLPPLLPPEDDELALDLADLRAAVREVAELRAAGDDPVRAARRQAAAERRIRDRVRHRPGSSGTAAAPVTLEDVSAALRGSALVEYAELDGELFALTVAEGVARWRSLGPADPVWALVDRLPFALRRLATSRGDATALDALLRDAAARLDNLLIRPLTEIDDAATLVVVPIGRLQSLPWSLLPSCSGRPLTIAPSATTWHLAGRRAGPAAPPMVVAGPGLPGSEAEARVVADLYGVTALTGATATVGAVLGSLTGCRMAHFSGHGRIHRGHPLLSALELADGPLTGYELERLAPAPRLTVLAGCDTARDSLRAGNELLGLTATLLGRGAGQVVASVIPIPDASTVSLMVDFHARLVRGAAPADALAQAQLAVAADGPAAAAAAGFVCIGGAA